MRNILFLSLLFFCFLYQSNIVSFADCSTGFACSLGDLNQKLEQQKNIDLINNYFSRKIIEPNFVTKKNDIVLYSDLFTFNKIL